MDRMREVTKRARTAAEVETARQKKKGEVANALPKCAAIFELGVKNVNDLLSGLSALMADTISQRVGTTVANSISGQAAKMLKAVELRERFGKVPDGGTQKVMKLVN